MTQKKYLIIIAVLIVAAIAGILIYLSNNKQDETVTPNLSVSVINSTQNTDGTTAPAHPKDNLVYTLKAANPSDKVISGYIMEVSLGDITNSTTLIDAQGANYNSGNDSLVWTPLDIPVDGAIEKQFTVRVKDSLSAGNDQTIKITFNNEVITSLATQPVAITRPGNVGNGANYTAPHTGIPGWISFYLAFFITLGVLLFRIAYKLGRPTN